MDDFLLDKKCPTCGRKTLFRKQINHNNRQTENVLLNDLEETFARCLETARKKNADYAGLNRDPYNNFMNAKIVGVSPQKGVLVRLMDKMSRLGNLVEGREAQVKDESIDDTIDDAINYLAILKSMRKQKIT